MCYCLLLIVMRTNSFVSFSHLKFSLLVSVILGILIAPAYMLDYSSFLKIGICETNNIFLVYRASALLNLRRKWLFWDISGDNTHSISKIQYCCAIVLRWYLYINE